MRAYSTCVAAYDSHRLLGWRLHRGGERNDIAPRLLGCDASVSSRVAIFFSASRQRTSVSLVRPLKSPAAIICPATDGSVKSILACSVRCLRLLPLGVEDFGDDSLKSDSKWIWICLPISVWQGASGLIWPVSVGGTFRESLSRVWGLGWEGSAGCGFCSQGGEPPVQSPFIVFVLNGGVSDDISE